MQKLAVEGGPVAQADWLRQKVGSCRTNIHCGTFITAMLTAL